MRAATPYRIRLTWLARFFSITYRFVTLAVVHEEAMKNAQSRPAVPLTTLLIEKKKPSRKNWAAGVTNSGAGRSFFERKRHV
jgi:hypothetical protein